MGNKKLLTFLLSAVFIIASAPLFAAPPSPDTAPFSKEMLEKMADMHTKMAACLRSDKSFETCQAVMHAECQTMMKDCPMMKSGGCPMMDGTGGIMGKPK